jgi:hypothetical protein
LTDLRWLIFVLLTGLLAAPKLKAPGWVIVLLATAFGIVFLIYLAAYVYFALKAPDALRSEKFTLSKLAIEKSVKGDNIAGFIDPTKELPPPSLSAPKQPEDPKDE